LPPRDWKGTCLPDRFSFDFQRVVLAQEKYMITIKELRETIVAGARCPRLVRWRQAAARNAIP
jgi:hypothetical protein